MGKTKAKATEIKATIETESKADTTNIGYSGNITVKVKKGKKIIDVRKLHNKGGPNLFKFLGDCLAGNYIAGERPINIMLFTATADEIEKKPTSIDVGELIWSDTTKLISALTYSISPDVTLNKAGDCIVTTTFRIPGAYFLSTNEIYKAAIYCTNANSDANEIWYSDKTKAEKTYLNNMCAYYLFEENGSWAPIDTTAFSGAGFELIIEWAMSISNR